MLLDRHQAKIVRPEQLAELVGARPRPRTVVMCHGVFDVVHPGHLRHLLYARSRGDVLVCSVTADRWISKGSYRPHVPQDLRAANLALLDIVDYVVVDDDAEGPLGLIARIQPDLYAKGFEYSPAVRPQQIRETAAVEVYGGEVLFTPGDVVYSSSALIEAAAPDLRWDKLALLMRRAALTFDLLRSAVLGMRGQRIHVVGDSIVDALLRCEMIGASGKTPTISVRRAGRDEFVGGAAVVALHARAAGAEVQFSTVLGNDRSGVFILGAMDAAGVRVCPVHESVRPTTVKEVAVVDGYRLLKIDTVDSRPISDSILSRLSKQIAETPGGAAVVFSDFRHGIFNTRTIPTLTAAIPAGCTRAADSQVASRWGNILDFQGFDFVAANEREARFALGDQDSGVRPLAARLYGEAHCSGLLLKLGARGILGFTAGADDTERSFVLSSFAARVIDPVGAGDALLAYAALALAGGAGLPVAAILGSLAAAAECAVDGNVPVASETILAKIDEAERELRV